MMYWAISYLKETRQQLLQDVPSDFVFFEVAVAMISRVLLRDDCDFTKVFVFFSKIACATFVGCPKRFRSLMKP